MEALFVLLGLAVIAIPFVVIGLLVSVSRLKRRVATLEERMLALGAAPVLGTTLSRLVAAPPAAEAPPAPAEPAAPVSSAWPVRQRRPEPRPDRVAAAEITPDQGSGLPPLPATPLAPPQQPEGPVWIGRLIPWMQANWVYLASAVSLGFAGIYLVQYGAEHGLLSPTMRVLLALALGAGLIAGGEVIRRRFGDEGRTSTAVLPSTLSAAGIVVLYAAILAARGLYGLIGAEVTFGGLLAVSAMALVFGWFYGPFLAAAGLTGAAAAPFLVGGEGGSSTLLFLYFGLLATSGLAIDAVRRWGWISFLALALAYGGGGLVWLGLFWDTVGYAGLLLWLAAVATVVPRLQLRPTHPGPAILQPFVVKPAEGAPRPVAPSWIATLAIGTTSLLLLALGANSFDVKLVFGALAGLAAVLFLAVRRAEGIADAPFLPSAAFLLLIPATGAWSYFVHDGAPKMSSVPSLIFGLGALISAAAFLRSLSGPWPRLHAGAAALVAPLAAVGIELFWRPVAIMGAYPWALHVIALAAAMTFAALRYAAIDGQDRRRAAYAALSALSLIALATFVLLSDAALTVALAVLVATAAWLDRRFRLPEMTWFISAGIAALGWRLVVYPGLLAYVEDAPLWEVLLAFGSALLGLGAARQLLPSGRARTRAALESTGLAFGGVLLSILIWRLARLVDPAGAEITHWSASLLGLIWTALALAQVVRARQGGPLRRVRLGLAALEGIAAAGAFTVALTVLNPALSLWERVLGPQPFDTLLVAYGLPGLLLAVGARRSPDPRLRAPLAWGAGGFLALWAALAIRRFWRGDTLAVPGFTQPELYTYTVALLLLGGVLLYQAIARRSGGLRRVAMGVIALAIAKVFLVDAAGLTGLLRVFSFLGLGLVLAGLAWLNRWAAGRQDPEEPSSGPPPAPLTGS